MQKRNAETAANNPNDTKEKFAPLVSFVAALFLPLYLFGVADGVDGLQL